MRSDDVITFTGARDHLRQQFDRARGTGRPIIVTNHGRVDGYIVSPQQYDRLVLAEEMLNDSAVLDNAETTSRDSTASRQSQELSQAVRHNVAYLARLTYPRFSLMTVALALTNAHDRRPDRMTASAASLFGFMLLHIAGHAKLADRLIDKVFSLAWTEEHSGSDLANTRTVARPIERDKKGNDYWIAGRKWLINNAHLADYHLVVAKTSESLSLFLVPRESIVNRGHITIHVMPAMNVGTLEIDGPGRLIGRPGRALVFIDRLMIPSRYLCALLGTMMLRDALLETFDILSTKRLFGKRAIEFPNVSDQLYGIVLDTMSVIAMCKRAIVLNDSPSPSFHGRVLKSHALLDIASLLRRTLLLASSRGYVGDSSIGRNAIDSLLLPVFDGHYTTNILGNAKHATTYFDAAHHEDSAGRLDRLRTSTPDFEINLADLPHGGPRFFNIPNYVDDLRVPDQVLPPRFWSELRTRVRSAIASAPTDSGVAYRTATIMHRMEGLLAAAEISALMPTEHTACALDRAANRLRLAANAMGISASLIATRQEPSNRTDVSTLRALLDWIL